MKIFSGTKIATKLTMLYSAIFFGVIVLITLSTYFGLDFFLSRQAKDNIVLSSSALTRNIYDSVEAQDKAIDAQKEKEEKEAQDKVNAQLTKAATEEKAQLTQAAKLTEAAKEKDELSSIPEKNDDLTHESENDSESELEVHITPYATMTPTPLIDDDSSIPVVIDDNIWKINNDHLALGFIATLFDSNGKLLSTSEPFVKIDYLNKPGEIFTINRDDRNIMALNTVLKIRNKPYYLQVLKEMNEESAFLHLLLIALICVGFLGLLLSFLTGYIVSRRMLKPIEEITKSTKQISAQDLKQRIRTDGPDDELRHLSLTINEMLERLELSFNNQARFVSDASHELRTPVQVIMGYSRMLERWGKQDASVLDESVLAIRKESENMTLLIEHLLFLARGERTDIKIIKEKIEFVKLLEEITKETRMIAGNREIYLDIGNISDTQVYLNGDRNLIKEMLRAILDNSIKYTAENGTINIRLVSTEDKIKLSIEDNGEGISQEQIPFLFERFYRADPARRRDKSGAGLGLSIVKWIADAHEVEIDVKSELGSGTIVKMSF